MNTITREEFAAAVAAAISSLHHVYREVDRLLVGIREGLAEDPEPLMAVRGTFQKSGRDPGRLIVRNEYGALFQAAIEDTEDADEDDDDRQEDEEPQEDDAAVDDEGESRRRKRKPAEIASGQPLLAIRVAMYDPREPDGFEPQLQYAAMTDWSIGSGMKAKDDQPFVLARYMLRRIPKSLHDGARVAKGGRLSTRAVVKPSAGAKKGMDRRLTCRLPMGIETQPLYSLAGAQELDLLVDRIKEMWGAALIERQAPQGV